jgi:hypothetical protein
MTNRAPSPFPWFDIWIEGCTTSFRMFETMAAVPAVLNARMPMIAAAAFNPLHGNWPDPPVAAVGAGLDVPAHDGGTASLYRRHDLQLVEAEVPGAGGPVRRTGSAEDVGDLE